MIKIGEISQRVIDLLQLQDEAGTPIFLGDSNIAHMRGVHPEDYEIFKDDIPAIIRAPDFVGVNPKDKSIEYVKGFAVRNKSVKVAVRVSSGGIYFVRTLYARDNRKVERFIKKGYLIKY